LDEDQEVPYTRKGTIFRKKLEGMFGGQVACLLGNEDNQEHPTKVSHPQAGPASWSWSKSDVKSTVLKTVADVLKISVAVLNVRPDASFAEVRTLIAYYSVDLPY
jgi:hypothetical protein